MDIYYLCRAGTTPAHPLSNPIGGSFTVQVRGGTDWYAARARALEAAAAKGRRFVLVVAGHCTLAPVRLVKRSPVRLAVHAPTQRTDNALMLYMARLLEQHAGAVVVPPVAAVGNLPAGWAEQVPVTPLAVAYRLEAALTGDYTGPRLEYSMVSRGYRIITLSDYGARGRDDACPLDTYGTTTQWNRAYEQALEALR